jgi:hypothetical protein
LLAVLANRIYQPSTGRKVEAAIQWTVFRELNKELFGGIEVEKGIKQLKHDWYRDICPGINYFCKHEVAYVIEPVSLGVNALSGN